MTGPFLPLGTDAATAAQEATADTAFDDVLLMFLLASAYHSAQSALAVSAERASRDLWMMMRPVDDVSMAAWMGEWNTLLASSAELQQHLTEGYAGQVLRQYGVRTELEVAPVSIEAEVAAMERWLDKEVSALVPTIRAEVEASAEVQAVKVAQAAQADRAAWLHSPVIEARGRLAAGEDVETTMAVEESRVASLTDFHLREVEALTADSIRWPRFKDGTAMLYMRVPTAGACGWCRIVSTRLYSLASYRDGAKWHRGCRCTWRAITSSEAETYHDARKGGKNYYESAKAIGMWSGPTDVNYQTVVGQRFDPKTAAKAGYLSRHWNAAANRFDVYDATSGTYVPE